MFDLEAIRQRNEERKSQFAPEEWGADTTLRDASADIDALLAEVERLNVGIEEVLTEVRHLRRRAPQVPGFTTGGTKV
jgi:hypothetical protein